MSRKKTKREIRFKLEDISVAASRFIEDTGAKGVMLFEGGMGSGKTTFISEMCRLLGVSDDIGSPTFSLVNEYADRDGQPIYHFDLYRLESPQEALEIGAPDYLESGCLCLVEWPDTIADMVPEEAMKVNISVNEDGSRLLSYYFYE